MHAKRREKTPNDKSPLFKTWICARWPSYLGHGQGKVLRQRYTMQCRFFEADQSIFGELKLNETNNRTVGQSFMRWMSADDVSAAKKGSL